MINSTVSLNIKGRKENALMELILSVLSLVLLGDCQKLASSSANAQGKLGCLSQSFSSIPQPHLCRSEEELEQPVDEPYHQQQGAQRVCGK